MSRCKQRIRDRLPRCEREVCQGAPRPACAAMVFVSESRDVSVRNAPKRARA